MPIEGFRRVVCGIDQDGHGRNVGGGFQTAAQGIHQKKLTDALALHALATYRWLSAHVALLLMPTVTMRSRRPSRVGIDDRCE